MISIFLPTYNCSSIISETIDSILKQSYVDFELLCVDDGSSDNTLDVLNEYASVDHRIKVFSKHNEGSVPFSWNYVFPHLNGEFTLYMSHDDILEERYLEKMVHAQKSYNADAVISSVIFFGNDIDHPEGNYSELNKKNDMSGRRAVKGRSAFLEMLNYDIPGFGLWRTSLIKSIGMPTESFNSDEAMQRIWAKNCEVVAFSDAKFGYRQSSDSIVKGLKPYHYASLLSQRRLLSEITLIDFIKHKEVRRFFVHFVMSLIYLTRRYYTNSDDYNDSQKTDVKRMVLNAWNPFYKSK